MKKFVLLLFVITLCLAFTSCFAEQETGEFVTQYPTDSLPKLFAATDEYWFYMLSEYTSSDYTLGVGASPDEFEKVYDFTDARVWHIEAEGDTVVWSEDRDTYNTYNVYCVETGKVETVFTADKSNGLQLADMGIYNGNVYYGYTDYANAHSAIYRYNVATGETEEIYEIPFVDEPAIMALGFDGEYISIASGTQVMAFNAENGDKVFSYNLAEDISYVYGLSYDAEGDVMGIYYQAEKENVGIIKNGELLSIYTLNENHYVYNENIVCRDGHLYWISLANVSGKISDHYVYVDYDYTAHTPTEIKGTFGFDIKDDYAYLLRMGADATDLKLYKLSDE